MWPMHSMYAVCKNCSCFKLTNPQLKQSSLYSSPTSFEPNAYEMKWIMIKPMPNRCESCESPNRFFHTHGGVQQHSSPLPTIPSTASHRLQPTRGEFLPLAAVEVRKCSLPWQRHSRQTPHVVKQSIIWPFCALPRLVRPQFPRAVWEGSGFVSDCGVPRRGAVTSYRIEWRNAATRYPLGLGPEETIWKKVSFFFWYSSILSRLHSPHCWWD